MESQNEQVRSAAITALGQIRDRRAVQPLIAALKQASQNRSEQLVRTLAQALGEIKDPAAVGPLLDAAREPDYYSNRFWPPNPDPMQRPVAWPLCNIGLPAIQPLAAALHDPSQQVREVAAWVLDNLSSQGGLDAQDMQPAVESLVAALDDSSAIVRQHAALVLGELEDHRAVEALIEIIATADEDSFLDQNAASRLGTLKDAKGFEPLVKLLAANRPTVRAAAVTALGWMGDPRAVDHLLAPMYDRDPTVRAEAALALGNLKASVAVAQLLVLLRADNDANVRAAAAEGLGRLGDARALDSLVTAHFKDEFTVRIASALALVRLDATRRLPPVSRCLQDESRKNREAAATAVSMAFLKTDALVPLLAEARNDPSHVIRLYAADALGYIGSPAAGDVLLSKIADRDNLPSILGALGKTKTDKARKAVIEHLDDPSPAIRANAAYALVNFPDERSVALLIAHLTDPASEVRLTVIRALTDMKAKSAIEPLTAVLEDDDPQVGAYAARALKRIKD